MRTLVLGEGDGQRHLDDLLAEDVRLVQEENDGSLCEPLVVAHVGEELERLGHAVGAVVLGELLIVLREGDEEDDGVIVLEVVDPLLALTLLATDVDDVEHVAIDGELDLLSADGEAARFQDIVVVRLISG